MNFDANQINPLRHVPFPPKGRGIQTRIASYCKCVAQRGIGVTVFVILARRCGGFEYQFNGARVIELSGGKSQLLKNGLQLIKAARSARTDVIHVFTGASTLMGAFSLILGRIMIIPSAFSLFGKEDLAFGSFFSKSLFAFSASIATSISTNSEATRSLLPARFQSKTTVLSGGAEIESVQHGLHRDGKKILFVGRLVRRKGVDDLLEAYSIVAKTVPGSKLTIVGDGPEKAELYQKSVDMKLHDVEFKGALFGKSLSRQYEESSVCVLPSKYVDVDNANEGLGLTLIEASMHSTPLVGTRHGGIPEIVRDGVNGFLVPEGSPLKLAGAITKILSDDKLRDRMGENALKIALSNFTWEAATERLLISY